MPERHRAVLRLQPHMLPALRAAFDEAAGQVGSALSRVRASGYLPEPWLGDEESRDVAAFYTKRALDGPLSSYQALTAYWGELERVRNTLQVIEDSYHRTDGDNATRLGRA